MDFSGSLYLRKRQACHKEDRQLVEFVCAVLDRETTLTDCINSNRALMLIGLIFIILKVTFFLSACYMFDTTLSS